MSKMDKILAEEHVTFPMGWDEMGERKTAFGDIFMSLLEKRGYTDIVSLKIRGAYAYEATNRNGRRQKIGLKTAYDGWLNTAHVMVERVDKVWVMSFRWDGDRPGSLDVHEISSKDLLEVFDEIHTERKRIGRQNDHTYMPVLVTTLTEHLKEKGQKYYLIKGALEEYAKVIFTAPLVWTNRVNYGIVTPKAATNDIPVVVDPLQGVEDPIAALKQLIAKRNNTTVDKVKVLIEA